VPLLSVVVVVVQLFMVVVSDMPNGEVMGVVVVVLSDGSTWQRFNKFSEKKEKETSTSSI
jgi:hypothetical protein